MRRFVVGAAAAVALATLVVASAGAQATDERFRINLKTRSFLPPQAAEVAGIRSAREGPGDRVHFLAQFSVIPNAAARSAIAAQGVRLVAYVTANTYVASSSVSALGRLGSIDGLRWAGPLEARDKIAADLARGNIGVWARAGQGRVVLSVMGHQDVAVAELQSLAARHGARSLGRRP